MGARVPAPPRLDRRGGDGHGHGDFVADDEVPRPQAAHFVRGGPRDVRDAGRVSPVADSRAVFVGELREPGERPDRAVPRLVFRRGLGHAGDDPFKPRHHGLLPRARPRDVQPERAKFHRRRVGE